MKRLLGGIAVSLMILLATSAAVTTREDELTKEKLVGTWEGVSPALPKEVKDLKYITPTHFIWVIYDRAEKKPLATAGGTWTLQGDTYKEHIEFASESHDYLRGQVATFTIKIDGDRLVQKGGDDANIEVDEIWKRVK